MCPIANLKCKEFRTPNRAIERGASVAVKVLYSSETELCEAGDDEELHTGQLVVIPTRYGADIGRVLGPVAPENVGRWKEVRDILRVATESDIERFNANRDQSEEAFEVCRRRIDKRRLDMKLVSAHYVLDNSRLLFFFTADDRVDFRELVKDLVSEFHTRIELRQIGVRDDARILGGVGVCGRTLCCHGMTDRLKPVSIKMAKVQNLALNSMKISGPCGRLLCCLAYEHDTYVEARSELPNEGTRIPHEDTVFRLVELNVLAKTARLSSRDGRYLTCSTDQLVYDRDASRWRIREHAEVE
ncbi:MAG: stage 0 sporulation family protein [Spirochaetaceae bacterium]